MNIQSEKPSENEDMTSMLNRRALHELRSDLKRAKRLTVVSTALAVFTQYIGIGFKESLFCTGLSILSVFTINSFVRRYEKRMTQR